MTGENFRLSSKTTTYNLKLKDSDGLSWYLNTILYTDCLTLHNFQNVEK